MSRPARSIPTPVFSHGLLQEVAKERLVVMVTHNPELAELYANRIVTLRDGVICSDTNPFEPDSETLLPTQTQKTWANRRCPF